MYINVDDYDTEENWFLCHEGEDGETACIDFLPGELSFYRKPGGVRYRYADLQDWQRQLIVDKLGYNFSVRWGCFWRQAYLHGNQIELYAGDM